MKQLLKAVLFIALTICLIAGLQRLFYGEEQKPYHSIKGFYSEKKNSLDAVYIGASNVYEYWQAPLAWEDHGIAVYSFTAPRMAAATLKYMLAEAHKTQPDALFIIGVNVFKLPINNEIGLHSSTDYLPFTVNKVKMVRDLTKIAGIDGLSQRLEFYLPMVRFHDKWQYLTSYDFSRQVNGLKGASVHDTFRYVSNDYREYFQTTDVRKKLTSEQADILNGILNFCHDVHPNVLFVVSPQVALDSKEILECNTICDIIRECGFSVLNLRDQIEQIGMDLNGDYYDDFHSNIHGAIKFTEYLSQYLIKRYGFVDKRGDPEFSSWDEAAEKYEDIIRPVIFDIERSHEVVDLTLEEPCSIDAEVQGTNVILRWSNSDNADGYAIYRKTGEWERIAEADKMDPCYEDSGLIPGVEYTYTVVPYKVTHEGMVYGHYSRKGISERAEWPAPELLEVCRDESGNIISWAAVSGVNDYCVYRRTEDGPWIEIASSVKDLYYVDSGFIPGETYAYTVSAYTNDIQGYRDPEGLSITAYAE